MEVPHRKGLSARHSLASAGPSLQPQDFWNPRSRLQCERLNQGNTLWGPVCQADASEWRAESPVRLATPEETVV